MARAPTPTIMVMMKKAPISSTPVATDPRAALASGTVKKRISRCGSPAVPNSSASPKEIELTAFGCCRPVAR